MKGQPDHALPLSHVMTHERLRGVDHRYAGVARPANLTTSTYIASG